MDRPYIVARWGASPAVMAWELFNEMDWTDEFAEHVTEAAEWHVRAAAELRALDPTGRPITTSFAHGTGHPEIWAPMDIVQAHHYGGEDLAQAARAAVSGLRALHDKPVLLAEIGIGLGGEGTAPSDPDGRFLHNAQWGSLMAGAAGAAWPWWWDVWIHPSDVYHRFRGISAFVSGRRLDEEGYAPTALVVETSARADVVVSPTLDWGQKAPAGQIAIGRDGTAQPGPESLSQYLYGEWKSDGGTRAPGSRLPSSRRLRRSRCRR